MSLADLPDDSTRLRGARRRFRAALGLFFFWVGTLAALAFFTGRQPVQNPAAIERR